MEDTSLRASYELAELAKSEMAVLTLSVSTIVSETISPVKEGRLYLKRQILRLEGHAVRIIQIIAAYVDVTHRVSIRYLNSNKELTDSLTIVTDCSIKLMLQVASHTTSVIRISSFDEDTHPILISEETFISTVQSLQDELNAIKTMITDVVQAINASYTCADEGIDRLLIAHGCCPSCTAPGYVSGTPCSNCSSDSAVLP
jgi:hypothetical protein